MERSNFDVIITAVSNAYVELLIGKLVSHGWTVSPTSKNGPTITGVATVIALTLEKHNNISDSMVSEEIIENIRLLGMSWLSMVIIDNKRNVSWWASKQLHTSKSKVNRLRLIKGGQGEDAK